jgi:hypothetical protein
MFEHLETLHARAADEPPDDGPDQPVDRLASGSGRP